MTATTDAMQKHVSFLKEASSNRVPLNILGHADSCPSGAGLVPGGNHLCLWNLTICPRSPGCLTMFQNVTTPAKVYPSFGARCGDMKRSRDSPIGIEGVDAECLWIDVGWGEDGLIEVLSPSMRYRCGRYR